MLGLTRRKFEKIYVGTNQEIEIVVLDIQGGQVKLGIKAPKEMPILREEILDSVV